MVSFSDLMKSIIYSKGRGNFITPEDFNGKVSPASMRTELVNFNNTRLLIHVARGLYFFPHIGKDGKQIRPTLLDIIKFTENSTKGIVYPTKEAALYLIGATEVAINPVLFYTTGQAKTINLNSGPELSFKKMPKSFKVPAFSTIEMRALYMAYSEIDESKITKKLKIAMNKFCSQLEPDIFEDDIEFLPLWMKENLNFPQKQKNESEED